MPEVHAGCLDTNMLSFRSAHVATETMPACPVPAVALLSKTGRLSRYATLTLHLPELMLLLGANHQSGLEEIGFPYETRKL